MAKCMWLFILPFITLPATAQQHVHTEARALLWRISGHNLARPSYLFGTIHAICPEDYLWTDKMKECLAKSDEVCFEINIADTLLTRKMATELTDKSGKKLEDYFTSTEYEQVQQYFKETQHIDITRFQHMKLAILQSLIIKKSTACAHPVSYERRIMQTAQENNKEVMGLETVKEQIDILEAVPPEKIVRSLVAVANGYSPEGIYAQLVAAYRHQDLQALYSIAKSSNSIFNNDMLIDDRNKRWVPTITREIERSSVFFAVGAAHLAGEKGVIRLLQQQGYMVEPVFDTVNIHEVFQDLQRAGSAAKARDMPDVVPQPGYDINEYIRLHLHYPATARKQNTEGRVIVSFIINEDGTIADCEVLKGLGSGCDEEAVRIISHMPPWKPATKNDVPVRVRFTQPIVFKLENGGGEGEE